MILSPRHSKSGSLFAAGALLLPLAVMTVYLTATRLSSLHTPEALDRLALFLACALGAACLWQIVKSSEWKVLFLLVYFAAMGTAKFIYSFYFVCSVFGDCL